MTLRDLIERHEGRRSTVYVDSTGHRTIGVGHNLDAKPLEPDLYEPDGSLSDATIDEVLDADIGDAMTPLVVHCAPWFQSLDEVRQAVLVDLSFNLGWGELSTFSTFLLLMAAGNYDQAATDLMGTLWARQVGVRATEDAGMLRLMEWPA